MLLSEEEEAAFVWMLGLIIKLLLLQWRRAGLIWLRVLIMLLLYVGRTLNKEAAERSSIFLERFWRQGGAGVDEG